MIFFKLIKIFNHEFRVSFIRIDCIYAFVEVPLVEVICNLKEYERIVSNHEKEVDVVIKLAKIRYQCYLCHRITFATLFINNTKDYEIFLKYIKMFPNLRSVTGPNGIGY